MDMSNDSGMERESILRAQLDEGIALARRGDRAAARDIFRRIIHTTPYEEDAWLWLAWVAEDSTESQRYLQEAQMLLPDSMRIAEATRWVKQLQRAPSAEPDSSPDSEIPAAKTKARTVKPMTDRLASMTASLSSYTQKGTEAAQRARDGASRAMSQLSANAAETHQALRQSPLRRFLVPVASSVAILAIIFLAFLGLSRANMRSPIVSAMELPPPAADPTSTPTIKQRTDPLWVQVDVAWTRQDWDSVIRGLEQIRQADPRNDEARKRLAEAYYQRSNKLIQANKLEEASLELDTAIRLDASNAQLQETRRLLRMYLSGVQAYWAQDWPRVVENLKVVYKLSPDFRDTHVMLGQAYYKVGIERQESQVWDEARDAFQASLELLPDSQDARKRLAVVQDIILPPKRIEVSLSKQMVTLYENHKAIKVFTVCTGRANTPTIPGRYQIQSKLPMAYASAWDLDMPWWLGIYWAGGSENGFHALPILSNGRVLWGGYLGSPCSYGCIVLDTADAKFLYDWAEIGNVVLVSR